MRRALVFGGSGQIGTSLLARLTAANWQVVAVSRHAQPPSTGVQWLQGDLSHVDGLPAWVDAIFSCGPLDHFGRWYAESTLDASRVVAFGSTSVDVKATSIDPAERDVASRLAQGEHAVFAAAAMRGAGATVLRPTLVYGVGRDQTLTRIATVAQRWGRMVLPRGACGLRQPVHVDDLSAAALAASEAFVARGRAYALAGGETLPYREMVARVLAVLQPPPALIELPAPLFHAAAWSTRLIGRAGIGEGVVARLRSDLVFDMGPASRDLAYAPRLFRPTAEMFRAR
jgi:nucleoside-diphosphate-sugar epimerase